jgi:flagellin
MSLVINTNIASLQARQNLDASKSQLNTSLQRLSSGLRINSAADDPAGLAIADRFTTQINGLNQAAQNANDAISLAQTAGGALQQVTNNLQTIRQLAVEAANSSNSPSDRQALDQEVQQQIAEINRIATQTSFNGQNVLDGTFGHAVFQVGANVGQTISIDLSTSTKTNAIGSYVNNAGSVSQVVAPTDVSNTSTNVAKAYNGVTATAFDGSSTYSITPNGGTATSIQASSGFVGSLAGQTSDSAYAKAAAINGSGISGVTASAVTNLDLGAIGGSNFVSITGNAAGTQDYNLQINGVSAFDTGSVTGAATFSVTAAISQINQVSSQTGVTASQDVSGGLQLTAADGRNIALTETVTGGGTSTSAGVVSSVLSTTTNGAIGTPATGSTTATYRGQVTLQSNASLSLNAGAQAALGFAGSNQQAASSLAQQNVTTIAAANATILSVDSALTAVDSLQATFGAIQNRFDSAIASIGTAVTNLSAARSQVQDANFAAETSNLTRAQILQQAGVSILAQANALPQGVLKLLQ